MKNLDQQFARFLRGKRGDLTYEQFGKLLGLRKSTVYRLENHNTYRQSFSLKMVQQVCERLKCSVKDVFED